MPSVTSNSLILVTGATGYIGSHVVDQTLTFGHRVRATARNAEKAAQITSYYETKGIGKDRLEVVLVDDFVRDGAWDEAVKGVDGIAHIASVLTFSSEWEDVVTPSIKGIQEILKSASKETSVKRVVLASSSTASIPGDATSETIKHADASTWNEHSVQEAKTSPNGWNVYSSSKVLGEKAAWEFMDKNKPHFDLVTILPGLNFGPFLPSATTTSSGGFVVATQQGSRQFADSFPPQWFVDVRDVAKLHIVALSDERVKGGERIWTVTEPYSWNAVIDAINNTPHKTTAQKSDKVDPEPIDIDIERFKELLKPHGGLKTLQQTISDMFP